MELCFAVNLLGPPELLHFSCLSSSKSDKLLWMNILRRVDLHSKISAPHVWGGIFYSGCVGISRYSAF